MKEDIKNTSDSSKETRNVFIGAKVTPTQKEQIKSLAGQCGIDENSVMNIAAEVIAAKDIAEEDMKIH